MKHKMTFKARIFYENNELSVQTDVSRIWFKGKLGGASVKWNESVPKNEELPVKTETT